MSKELKQKMRSGGIWLVLSNILTIASQLLAVALLSRMLGPEAFGIHGNGLLLLELTAVFTYPFINKSIILKKEASAEYLSTATTLSFLLSAAAGLILFFSAPFIAAFFHHDSIVFVVRTISVIFLLKGFYQPYQSVFERDLRFREISNVNLAASWLGFLIVPVCLAYYGFGYKSLILGLLAYELVFLIYFTIRSRLYFGRLSPTLAREIITDARHLILQALGNKLATNGDYLIISRFLGPAALGYYTQAYKIMKMPTTIIGNVINSLSFASLSKISEDNDKLRKAFVYSSFILALFSFPILVITLLFSKEIVLILLGPKWLSTIPVLQILSFGIFLRMSYKVPGTILKAKQLFRLTARIQIIYALNILVFSVLMIRFGIEGVAIGTLAALALQYGQLCWHVARVTGATVADFYTILLRPMAFAAIVGGTAFLLRLGISTVTVLRDEFSFIIVMLFILPAALYFIHRYGLVFFGEPYAWWLDFATSKKERKEKKNRVKPGKTVPVTIDTL
ncbi:MAG: lipopolysaccharide biosynthesis protein [Sphingobacteriales bacterium]|nr:MAG: lipopolysaccharide biosynthesis protein [Sphingobacteriales bacterium]